MRRFTVTEKFIIGAMVILASAIGLPNLSNALEFQADKGVAFNFTAPIVNSSNTTLFATGVNNTAFYIHSNDNTTFATAATNKTIIGTSGVYLFQLNATEMNHSRIGILINDTGVENSYLEINTVPKEALDVVDGIVDDILVDTGTTLDGKIDTIDTNVDSILEDTGTDIPATLSTISGYIDTEVADILTDTGTTLPASLGALTNVTLGSTQTFDNTGTWTGNVAGNVTGTIGGLTAAALADFFDTDSTTDYATSVAGSVVKEIADNAGGLTEAGIADAVWDEAISGHTSAGTTGKKLSESPTPYDIGP